MKKILLFCMLFLLASTYSFSQEKFMPKPKYSQLFKSVPEIDSSSPEWVKLMYSETPNYKKISDAFNTYYQTNPFQKNTHTQNFKYFSKIVRNQDYLLEDGTIYIPTVKEKEIRNKKLLKTRFSNVANKSALNSNWTPVGPFETFGSGGTQKRSEQVNIYTFDQSLSNPNVLFSGSETAAVFKSVDKGMNWVAVGNLVFNDGGILSIKIDPTNENIVYVGAGDNLYKTIDGGANWSPILNIAQLQISAITINPSNPLIVLAAGTDGLHRSIDGGASFTQIFTDVCWDIRLKTDDPSTVFLAKRNTTTNSTEILKSTDNGATFTLKSTGWFSPIGGRATTDGGARIGVTNADANRLYVILIGEENDAINDGNYIGIYRSDDAAESWSTPYDGDNNGTPDNEPGGPYSSTHWCLTTFDVDPTVQNDFYQQEYYNLDIAVSDVDADKFMVGALNMYKSEDGGKSYTPWGGYACTGCGTEYRHPDIQEIEINGNDVWVSTDGGVDLYNANLDFVEARNNGISGADYWGFDQGWNYDVFVGGRYHNGNAAYYETYPNGKFLSLGGGETSTGYVNKGENRKVYHSDINGKLIPDVITGSITDLAPYLIFPNESPNFTLRSEVVNDPRYWNTLYVGKDNKLWKSEDEGQTFNLVNEFGTATTDLVKAIEISRADPNIIFVTQKEGSNGKLWKSIDGGNNWTNVTIPANNETMYLSLNTENELYLALNNGDFSTDKVFKSTDLGANWTNLTTASLDFERIENIQVQDGTNGGVYLTSNKVIWYRNNTHTDWQLFSTNLPLNFRFSKILPFYKKGLVRVAGTRGIWESNFFEPSLPKAQPMVANKAVNAGGTSVQFEDFSVLNHTGASWEWQFPGASTVSSTTVRNPVVTYNSNGTYDVTLKVTDTNGATSTKTITDMIVVTGALGVNDNLDNAFKIYPNPVSAGEQLSFHNIKTEAKFIMFDINGKQIIKAAVNEQTKFKLPNLKAGVYFYSIETDTKIQNGKILVQD